MSEKRFRVRLALLAGVLLLGSVVVGGHVFYLQSGGPERWAARALEQRTRRFVEPPRRGRILDRFGRVIVDHQPKFLLRWSGGAELTPELWQELGDKVGQRLAEGRSVEVPVQRLARVAELCSRWRELELHEVSGRAYPLGRVASHVCGYVREELIPQATAPGSQASVAVGVEGMEKSFDDTLSGRFGTQIVLTSATGKPLGLLAQDPPQDGKDLTLSLDLDLQKVAEEALDAAALWLASQPGRRAEAPSVVLLMDLKTGEILVMAVRPSFSPELFLAADEGLEKLLSDPMAPLMNRAIAGLYPPASTFKLVTGAAVLKHHPSWAGETFFCSGKETIGGRVFHCFQTSGHGRLNFQQALALSCDSVFYQLATRLPIEELRGTAAELGFGEATGVELPGEVAGLLPGPDTVRASAGRDWFAGDSANLGIGQGALLVTPIQLLTGLGRLLTGRADLKPRLTPATERAEPAPCPSHLAPLVEGARQAVTSGTALSARSQGLALAGKTGTAEAPTTADNPKGLNHTWFVAWAPADRPEVVGLCLFEGSGGYGGEVAAPVLKQVFDYWHKNS